MKEKKEPSNSIGPNDLAGYKTILRSIQEGICRIGFDRTVIYANEAASRILGLPLKRIVGTPYPAVFFGSAGPEDPRCAPIEFTISEGEVAHINSEKLVRPDGTEFLAEMICVPVSEAERAGAILSFIDVTDRREVEDVISKARDEALKAARSKAEFLAHMSHEIRTPLTGIIGIAELLSRTADDKEQAEYIRMLRSSTDFLSTLVNDILDFSKLEAGKFLPKNESFSLRVLAAEAVDPYRVTASEKELALTVELDESLPEVLLGDAGFIRQILNNLLSNSVKFTEHGSVTLKISPGANKNIVRFAVIDTGPGIDSTQTEQLFRPFEQAESKQDAAFEGTGLGLTIARRFVLLLKGEIGVDTRKGSGAEFWFEIPLKPGTNLPVEKARVLSYGDKEPQVLVVEDNPISLTVIQKMLAHMGLNSDSAENGPAAIESCRTKEFDIVFMDIEMPGMDGYETSRQILALGNGSPSIIAFTANAAEDDHGKRTNAGMTGILRKPFTEQDLIDVINRYAAGAGGIKFLDLNKEFIEHSLYQFVEVETLNRLLSLESDDPRGFLTEILEVFVRHVSQKLLDLGKGMEKKDRKKIKRLAHNLRGSSANIGILRLSSIFGELELGAFESDWAELNEIVKKINKEYDAVREAISRLKIKEDPNDGKRGIGN